MSTDPTTPSRLTIILTYLLRGKVLQLLRKWYNNRRKRHQLLHRLGQKTTPQALLTKLRPNTTSITLIIDHYLGGGANFYREERIHALLQTGQTALLLCNDSIKRTFILGYITAERRCYTEIQTLSAVSQLVTQLRLYEILVNNVFSYHDALHLPTFLLQLKHATSAKLTLLLHDYFMLCPSFNLMDANLHFCDIPAVTRCHSCLAQHRGLFTHLVSCRDISAWRTQWGACLMQADAIVCFSQSSERLLLKAYPDLDTQKITITPHTVTYIHAPARIHNTGVLHIGVVGAINSAEKGAHVVSALVKLLEQQQPQAKLTVIGSLHNAPQSPCLTVTGPYPREKLTHLVEHSGANVFLLPSLCPETFSYVTEELIQLQVPLMVFDLGAPAERVAHYAKGKVVHFSNAEQLLHDLTNFYQQHYQGGLRV